MVVRLNGLGSEWSATRKLNSRAVAALIVEANVSVN